jgi:hypothetical protein
MTVVAYPVIGAIAWLAGAGMLLVGMLAAWKIARSLAPAEPGPVR